MKHTLAVILLALLPTTAVADTPESFFEFVMDVLSVNAADQLFASFQHLDGDPAAVGNHQRAVA